jgi:CDP-glycerol glycerophosphotransferase
LYAPTWRGIYANPRLEQKRLLRDLALLADLPCKLVFRPHPHIAHMVPRVRPPVSVAAQELDTSDLLAVADVLVTDYSSIFFDFLPTKRPILLYVHDLDEYRRERGLYFPVEDMPGTLCFDGEELKKVLARHLAVPYVPDEKHLAALDRFCPYEDGRSCERVAAAFFFKETEKTAASDQAETPSGPPPRPEAPVLFYAGSFPSNGITISFLNLAKELCAIGLPCVLAITPRAVEATPENFSLFAELPAAVRILGCARAMNLSLEEYGLEGMRENAFAEGECPPHAARILRGAYAREYRRLFGYARFSALVNFDGYNRHWVELFAATPESSKVLYLHNDMRSECLTKYPRFEHIFHLYRQYDLLVSVTESLRDLNRDNLAAMYGIEPAKFVRARNLVDGKKS